MLFCLEHGTKGETLYPHQEQQQQQWECLIEMAILLRTTKQSK